ncbi:hypothetical protein HC766_06235 [Candidatus Gracilibacteria bacterium]|nr:hypothetical protein [Candidatus Gracilibacteria bacterium]
MTNPPPSPNLKLPASLKKTICLDELEDDKPSPTSKSQAGSKSKKMIV